VAASLQYLGRLSAEPRRAGWTGMTAQDVDLTLEIAGAYIKVARVQGIPINSNLGQFAQAKESLAKANKFVESVLALPERPQRARALLLSAEIARDSTILADSENREADTMAYARKTGERLEALMTAPGITAEQSAAAAAVYSNLALTYCNRHRLDEATTYARKGVEIARAGKDERQLGRLLGVLANASRFAGSLNDALTAIRSSRAILEKLADPNNVESMLQLSGALWREGLVLGELNAINLDRPREAEPLLQRALDIAEGLARKDPEDYTSRSYVSMAGRELGDILRDGQPARSLAVYDLALGRLAEVRNNHKARREEVWLLAGSSYALRKLGRAPEARQRIETALDNLRKLKEYPARAVEPGGESDAALRALADDYAANGDTAAAIRTYRELQDKLIAANPHPQSDLRHANVLSRLYRDLSALYRKANQPAEAMLLDQQRLDMWREWDRRLPGNPFVTRQLREIRPAFSLL
jgi:tetratricopeptide (TPR) repeat protein